MIYFLWKFLCIVSVYSPSNVLITALRIDRSGDVEELIERILESDKFDLLANRIADRAVEMMRNIHNVTITRMGAADDSHRDGNGRENQSKPERGYRPTIREHSPFSDIGLKYKKFLKNKAATTDKKYVRNANTISGDTKATKKRKRKYPKESNKTETVKKYKSKFKQSNGTLGSGVTKGGGGAKYKRDEKYTTRGNGGGYGSGDSDNHSLLTSSKNTEEVNFKSNRESSRPSDFESGKRSRRKRILRKENGRLYYLDSSSDYGPYRDKIYDTADLL